MCLRSYLCHYDHSKVMHSPYVLRIKKIIHYNIQGTITTLKRVMCTSQPKRRGEALKLFLSGIIVTKDHFKKRYCIINLT